MSDMSDVKKPAANKPDDEESDIVWGARGLGPRARQK